MIRQLAVTTRRYVSNQLKQDGKRFIQTIPTTTKSDFYSGLNYSIGNKDTSQVTSSKWAKHGLGVPQDKPKRKSRQSKFQDLNHLKQPDGLIVIEAPKYQMQPKVAKQESVEKEEVKVEVKNVEVNAKPKRRVLKPRKALITLSSNAISHLQQLLDQPEPKLIRIGVRNRGCSGLTYNLEYVDQPGKFDEIVEQDGVKVVIDSKALFSIVGSEMDWLDDKLSSKFIFRNPNSKGTCGCGESFMV